MMSFPTRSFNRADCPNLAQPSALNQLARPLQLYDLSDVLGRDGVPATDEVAFLIRFLVSEEQRHETSRSPLDHNPAALREHVAVDVIVEMDLALPGLGHRAAARA